MKWVFFALYLAVLLLPQAFHEASASAFTYVLRQGPDNFVTADSLSTLKAACNTGKTILVPAGTYVITLYKGQNICAGLNAITIRGNGKDVTKLIVRGSAKNYFDAFTVTGGTTIFRDMTVIFGVPMGGQGSFIGCNGGTGLQLINMRLTGNTAIIAGADTNATQMINFESKGCSHVLVRDTEFSGWANPLLKTNASTAANADLRFIGDYGHDNSGPALLFNSPNGKMDNVEVIGGLYENGGGLDCATSNSALISAANVSHIVIRGVRFNGTTDRDAIHIEDNSSGEIVGNVFNITSPCRNFGTAITLLQNAVSGRPGIPHDFTISDNSIAGYGTATTGIKFAEQTWTQLSGGLVGSAGTDCRVGEKITLANIGGSQKYPPTITVTSLAGEPSTGAAEVTIPDAAASEAGWFTSNPTSFAESSASGACKGFTLVSPTFRTYQIPQTARISVRNNTIKGFETGIYEGRAFASSVVKGNTITAIGTGIFVAYANAEVEDNTIIGAIGLGTRYGGTFGTNNVLDGSLPRDQTR